jgi:hypothetical protein
MTVLRNPIVVGKIAAFIDDTNGSVQGMYDERTGIATFRGRPIDECPTIDYGITRLQQAIDSENTGLGDPPGRGSSFTDNVGDLWEIDLLDNNKILRNAAWLLGGRAVVYAWDGVTMFHKGIGSDPAEWYHLSPDMTWVNDGPLDPITGAPPAAKSANGTEGSTVVFPGGVTWTLGVATAEGFEALREGVRFSTASVKTGGYLVHGDKIYFQNALNEWWYVSGDNSLAFHGMTDPRTTTGGSGTFFDWQVSVNLTQGSNIISGIPTAEYNSIEEGHWLIGMKPIGLVRGALRTDKGPGGSYPNRSVANFASLWTGSTLSEVKYLTSTGEVYRWDGGQWVRMLDNGRIDRYIYSLVLARSYHGRVSQKLGGGQVAIVDRDGNPLACQRSVSGATLVVNNIPIIQEEIDALAPGAAGYELPTMLLPGAGVVTIDRNNFELLGFNETTSGVWTPRGVTYAGVQWLANRTGGKLRNMTWKGNYLVEDHGMNWAEGPNDGLWVAGNPSPVTDFNIPQANYHGSCATFNAGASGALVERVWFHDYPNALSSAFCDDNWYKFVHVRLAAPQMDYTGWMVSHNDCVGGGCEDADIVSTYSMKALEAFKSRGPTPSTPITYRRNSLVNGVLACNNSGMRIESNRFRWTADSHVAESYQSPHDWTVQISKNIANGFADQGVWVVDNEVRVEAYVYKGAATRGGIEVNTPDIAVMPRIESARHISVDYNSAVTSASVDNGTSSLTYPSGALAMNVAHCQVGSVICDGLSPHHFNWSGGWNQAAIRATNGSQTLSGFGIRRADPRSLALHGAEDIDFW